MRWAIGYRAGYDAGAAAAREEHLATQRLLAAQLTAAQRRADTLLDHLLTLTGASTLAARQGRVQDGTDTFLRNLESDPFEELPFTHAESRFRSPEEALTDADVREPADGE